MRVTGHDPLADIHDVLEESSAKPKTGEIFRAIGWIRPAPRVSLA